MIVHDNWEASLSHVNVDGEPRKLYKNETFYVSDYRGRVDLDRILFTGVDGKQWRVSEVSVQIYCNALTNMIMSCAVSMLCKTSDHQAQHLKFTTACNSPAPFIMVNHGKDSNPVMAGRSTFRQISTAISGL